jgi:hypothetical protein
MPSSKSFADFAALNYSLDHPQLTPITSALPKHAGNRSVSQGLPTAVQSLFQLTVAVGKN